MAGCLYLCPTPIGNLEDMPVRVVRILGQVDKIAAEDTRNTIRLLNHFEIKTPMTSYHEYNKVEKAQRLVELLLKGQSIALVTDAGTPAISDPGEVLVDMCHKAGIAVVSVPGPCACITALAGSGQNTRRFCFEGFLPSDKRQRRERLEALKMEGRTMVLYEAPHHLEGTLKELWDVLGERGLTICRELTKLHEEYRQTTLSQAVAYYQDTQPRGEFVLVIAGLDEKERKKQEQEKWERLSVEEHMAQYESQGMSRKEAMKNVAKDRGMTRRDVYQSLL